MNKTPIKELIKSLEGNKNAFPDTDDFKGIRSAFSNAIALAKEQLEKEKQMVIDAYKNGWEDGVNNPESNRMGQEAESYFEITFKQNQ